jgi:hypothetical protein
MCRAGSIGRRSGRFGSQCGQFESAVGNRFEQFAEEVPHGVWGGSVDDAVDDFAAARLPARDRGVEVTVVDRLKD